MQFDAKWKALPGPGHFIQFEYFSYIHVHPIDMRTFPVHTVAVPAVVKFIVNIFDLQWEAMDHEVLLHRFQRGIASYTSAEGLDGSV